MKLIINCIILMIVAYHAAGQTDTMDKKIEVKDSLQTGTKISINNLTTLSNGYYIHFRADSIQKNKSQSLSFYNSNIYKPTPCKNFWNAAGPIFFSLLADKTKHEYFYRPDK